MVDLSGVVTVKVEVEVDFVEVVDLVSFVFDSTVVDLLVFVKVDVEITLFVWLIVLLLVSITKVVGFIESVVVSPVEPTVVVVFIVFLAISSCLFSLGFYNFLVLANFQL